MIHTPDYNSLFLYVYWATILVLAATYIFYTTVQKDTLDQTDGLTVLMSQENL
jgi:hypothetical protein